MSIQPSPHQKQLILSVESSVQKSSLNSRTINGDNLEHCQKNDMSTDQLKWAINLWSLAGTLLTAGNLKITSTN